MGPPQTCGHPGIGAANGSKDRQIAEIAINQADVVVFVVMDDSIQTLELDFLESVRASVEACDRAAKRQTGLERRREPPALGPAP